MRVATAIVLCIIGCTANSLVATSPIAGGIINGLCLGSLAAVAILRGCEQ